MVDFAQFRNTEDVPNWTARSQGVNMPDWGGLAANLGKSLAGAAEVYGTVKGQEAQTSVADAVAQERINVGMDFAADEDPNVPADLNNRLERIQRASLVAYCKPTIVMSTINSAVSVYKISTSSKTYKAGYSVLTFRCKPNTKALIWERNIKRL